MERSVCCGWCSIFGFANLVLGTGSGGLEVVLGLSVSRARRVDWRPLTPSNSS